MADFNSKPSAPARRGVRWWPGVAIAAIATALVVWVRLQEDWPFQQRNLIGAQVLIITAILLLIWWTLFSRAPKRLRLAVTFTIVGAGIVGATLFRIRGVSGDLLPIVEFRWAGTVPTPTPVSTNRAINSDLVSDAATNSFPQFLGRERTGVLPGPRLQTNWSSYPPQVVWRRPIGPGWSGFAIVGNVAITQEQRGEEECVLALDLQSGEPIWSHCDNARYSTTIAGEGPRATPTIVSNRVFTFGATGILNCLDLATGKVLWSRNVVAESQTEVLAWGCTSSPLMVGDLVVVHGGENIGRSLFAYQSSDGNPAWVGGTSAASYASPIVTTLAGSPQVVTFNDGSISGHDPATGTTLWERAWGNGNALCSTPVVVSSNQVLFSSGYGVGSELLEISRTANGKFSVKPIWKSIRMKAKFAHIFVRDRFLYGLDDGIFACVDLKDGSQRWKEGRYGHGQGLLVGENYLLMAESGELVLLHPTPDASNELGRYRVFDTKTWNPIALSGDLLLVRNDREAACLRLKLQR
ncbi:MAG TPA: PQQ-binding-like beta-propeller repeat protein [Verrucomicrobiae bacterium]|nr:PQQ-binding-like beta-propeller repeat protein [Verrucomicrobiae bacterium]